MKRSSALLLIAFVVALALSGCGSLLSTSTPANPTAVASPTVNIEPSATPGVSSLPGTAVSFDRLSVVIPSGLATAGTGTLVPEASGDNVGPWEVAPEHIQFTLDGYTLQGKMFQAQIYVYPAQAYAQLQQNGAAAQSLEKLQAVLAQPSMVNDKALPFVPFFNVTQALAAQVKVIPFHDGQGVRMVTEYAMARAVINNSELFYHFEGLTADGQYYVIAILPVTAPGLPEDGQPGSAIPQGGVPVPDFNDMNADWMGYYGEARGMLQSLEPGAYHPSLEQLDALLGSLSIVASE